MNSYIVGLLLVAAPLAFAAFLLFFMMSGKGTTPLKEVKGVKKEEVKGVKKEEVKKEEVKKEEVKKEEVKGVKE